MGSKRHVKVLNVYKITAGSVLKDAVTTTSPLEGARWKVEAISDFNPRDPDNGEGGGSAIVEPGTANAETIHYSDIDEATDELVGVIRPSPKAHAAGVFVQEGETASVEKWALVKIDDEEELRPVPVPTEHAPWLRAGSYDEDDAPTIPVYFDNDDDELYVTGGPIGEPGNFDEDLEILPPVGGGDATKSTTDPVTGKVNPPKGMGFEDGKVPAGTITPIVTGGIGNLLFVRFPTLTNSSIVKYKVHCHTTAGFTPAATTLVGTIDLAGTEGFHGLFVIRDFPAGHVLDGSASDPPKPGTNYEVCVIPADGSGDAAGPYPRAAGSPRRVETLDVAPLAITQTEISDGAISTPKLQANSVTSNEVAVRTLVATNIATRALTGLELAFTTVLGENISGTTITADKFSVTTLSAITANLGTVTAGTLQTAVVGADRIGVSSSWWDAIKWIRASGIDGAYVAYDFATNTFVISVSGSGNALQLGADTIRLNTLADIGDIRVGGIPNFSGGTGTATGGILGYVKVKVGGTERRIPYYAI